MASPKQVDLALLVRLSCCFFFSCCGDRRVLHSFPTRRSSDLHVIKIEPLEGEPSRHIAPLGGGESQDRKSTRLNSSHANISYAVFCLKKKTTKRPIAALTIKSHVHYPVTPGYLTIPAEHSTEM